MVLDYAGLSTYDSLYRARDIFGVKRWSLLPRSITCTGPSTWPGPWAWRPGAWLPTGRTTGGQTMRDLREILARDKDVLWAIFQPEPTYLGDPEPLTGTP